MSAVVFVPVWVVVGTVAAPLDRVPAAGPTAPGDVWVIAVRSLSGSVRPLVFAVITGYLLSWLWGVLWHASVVGWKLWAADRRPGLGELLGHGLVRFSRFLRLALTSAVALALGLTVVWAPAMIVLAATGEPPPSGRLWLVVVIGGLGTMAVKGVIALATLRGAWLLGRADRHSAVAAWLRGFDGAIRQPVSSVVTLLVWWIPTLVAATVPLAAAWLVPTFGSTSGMVALLQLSLLVRAACRVGLLSSFAPTAGLPLIDR